MNNLGEKIRTYRKRARLSQMEMELEIGAASGSISRIENGEVNPSKETLSKIADVLKLSASEIGDLLDLKIYSPVELIKAINKISDDNSVEENLQTAVNTIFRLYNDYNGGLIFLKEGDYLIPKTISNMPKLEEVLKILPIPLFSYKLNLDKTSENLLIKTVRENQLYESNKSYDFCIDYIPEFITQVVERILNYNVGLSVPIRTKTETIGVILFTKTNQNYFSMEEKIFLTLFAEQIGMLIERKEQKDFKFISKVNPNE